MRDSYDCKISLKLLMRRGVLFLNKIIFTKRYKSSKKKFFLSTKGQMVYDGGLCLQLHSDDTQDSNGKVYISFSKFAEVSRTFRYMN